MGSTSGTITERLPQITVGRYRDAMPRSQSCPACALLDVVFCAVRDKEGI